LRESVGKVLAERVLDRGHAASLQFVDLVDVPPGTTVGRHMHGQRRTALHRHERLRRRRPMRGPASGGPGDVMLNQPGGTHAPSLDGDDALRMVVVYVGA
jgi:hypothetical protein